MSGAVIPSPRLQVEEEIAAFDHALLTCSGQLTWYAG